MGAEDRNRQTPPSKRGLSEEEFAKRFREAYDRGLTPEDRPARPLDLSFLEKDKKRMSRRERILKIAAVFLLIFVSSSVTVWISGNPSEAFDHPLQKIMERLPGGSYTTDPGSSGREEKSSVIYVDDEDKISSALKLMPQLYFPEYIPEGWEFVSLAASKKEYGDCDATIMYRKSDQVIEIHEYWGKDVSINIENYEEKIRLNIRDIFYFGNGDTGEQMATFYDNSVFVQINAPVEKQILLQIADGMVQREASKDK